MSETQPAIDIERCVDGLRQIDVSGLPDRPVGGRGSDHGDSRMKAIEDALSAIMADPEKALSGEYIGIKNYAGFGDQRADCPDGLSPRHGTIMFRISRQRGFVGAIGDNAIYLLECVRDFKSVQDGFDGSNRPRYFNLCDVLARREAAQNETDWCEAVMAKAGNP